MTKHQRSHLAEILTEAVTVNQTVDIDPNKANILTVAKLISMAREAGPGAVMKALSAVKNHFIEKRKGTNAKKLVDLLALLKKAPQWVALAKKEK